MPCVVFQHYTSAQRKPVGQIPPWIIPSVDHRWVKDCQGTARIINFRELSRIVKNGKGLDQVNNANSVFIFLINLLIIQGFQSGSVGQAVQAGQVGQTGQDGPIGPDDVGVPGSPGGVGGPGGPGG